MDVGDQNGLTCHQHLKGVTNTFRLQHPSPTSMFQYSTSVKLNWKSSVFELMLDFLQTTFSNINIYLKTYISYWFSFWVAKPRPYTPKCRHRCYSVRSFPWIRQTELKTNWGRSRPVSLLRNIQGKPMFWLATFITCIKKISVSYFS